jgi:hypothetical protein
VRGNVVGPGTRAVNGDCSCAVGSSRGCGCAVGTCCAPALASVVCTCPIAAVSVPPSGFSVAAVVAGAAAGMTAMVVPNCTAAGPGVSTARAVAGVAGVFAEDGVGLPGSSPLPASVRKKFGSSK